MNTEKKGTIFLVDDDPLVRKAVGRLLKSAGYDTEIFSSAHEFLESEHHTDEPACLVLDLKMPGLTGFDLQEELSAARYSMPIVFITGHGDVPSSVKAMKKGAVDFLPKPFEEKDLFNAISAALMKDTEQKSALIEQEKIQQNLNLLTQREHEIMNLVITGMLNKEIAYHLNISEKTVKIHRGRVMNKMGVSSVAELTRIAEKAGVKPIDIKKNQNNQ